MDAARDSTFATASPSPHAARPPLLVPLLQGPRLELEAPLPDPRAGLACTVAERSLPVAALLARLRAAAASSSPARGRPCRSAVERGRAPTMVLQACK